jgi:hypothetical protein
MNRLLVPALVLLFAVGFPGTAGAQPLTPPPVEPPEILPPGAGAPGPAAPSGTASCPQEQLEAR